MTQVFSKIKNKWITLLLTIICLLPVLYASIVWLKLDMAFYIVLGIFTLSFSLFLFPFLLFKMRTAFFVTWFWLLLAPFEIFSLLLYKGSFRGGIMLFILQSNYRETIELLSSYRLFIVVYFILLVAYLFVVVKFVYNVKLLKNKLINRAVLEIIIVFYIALYGYSVKMSYKPTDDFKHNLERTNITFNLKFQKIYPYNVVLGIYTGSETFLKIRTENKVADDFTFNAKQIEKTKDREIYVLIIGETARYDHFGINGYDRETTPLLKQIPNLFSFSDVLSEANATEISLPILLTRASATDYFRFKTEKGIVDLFNEVGFNSYWIANQSLGSHFIQRMTKDTKEKYFTPQDFDNEGNYDEELWKYFDEILDKKEDKQFVVIHTLGSHFRYNQRYPEKFEKFKPGLKGLTDYRLLGKNLKKELINSYDNTICYTDYFLSNTIKKLKNEDAVSYLFYISDHAESLFDNDVIFHGARNPVVGEIHVPMLVWFSDKYMDFNQEKVNAIKNNLDKKMTSAVTFYSLADLANIRFDGFSEKSIANINLQPDSVRYLINADEEIKEFR